MANIDFTLDDIRAIMHEEIVTERANTRQMFEESIQEAVGEVRVDIRNLREMLEEDAKAESRRLDRMDKRSLRTQQALARHIADKAGHRPATA